MQIHLLIAFPSSVMFHEATTSSFDLHSTPRLLLDMLHIAATGTYDLRTKVEARDRFEVDRDALLRPLTSAEGIALDLLLGLSATETALVDQVGQLLLHELIDFLHSLLETFLRCAGDVEVEWWVLGLALAMQNNTAAL